MGLFLGGVMREKSLVTEFYSPPNVPPTNPDTVRSVVFTHSLLDSSPDLVSELSFTASTDVNGGVIRCAGDFQTNAGDLDSVTDNITMQVGQMCKSVNS